MPFLCLHRAHNSLRTVHYEHFWFQKRPLKSYYWLEDFSSFSSIFWSIWWFFKVESAKNMLQNSEKITKYCTNLREVKKTMQISLIFKWPLFGTKNVYGALHKLNLVDINFVGFDNTKESCNRYGLPNTLGEKGPVM